eukprot:CAMPEP_0118681382 /NCGR_PEP_ID=MMETSP0800-20121206/4905_1 /TAXON_ID=210618 ORGANISM="Striatella unipunctata, Strain CCMP2910" /NCGR_SAMPLE_ID=MMETSP0800 /ASSEMBLY_ACC=CAM_ASM_000638 /LENGTH=587 /DNA_ID=CAMNT_0006577667 /DNA_START=93 /DNA_END=1856 /DNA_ORIENTATION=+
MEDLETPLIEKNHVVVVEKKSYEPRKAERCINMVLALVFVMWILAGLLYMIVTLPVENGILSGQAISDVLGSLIGDDDSSNDMYYAHDTLSVVKNDNELVFREEQEEEGSPMDVPIFKTTNKSFGQIISSNKYVLVNYYAHWCKWSQHLRREWDKLVTDNNDNDVVYVEINCAVYPELCCNQGVYLYPTIRFYRDGVKEGPDFRGSRTFEGMSAFIEDRVVNGIIDEGDVNLSLGASFSVYDDDIVQSKQEERSVKEKKYAEAEEAMMMGPTTKEVDDADADDKGAVKVYRGEHEGKFLEKLLKTHTYVFVDFYAPWCIYSQRLLPVWSKLEKVGFAHVVIVKVDCAEQADLCREHKIMAFPTMRLFKDGKKASPDFRGDRTVYGFREYLIEQVSGDYGRPFPLGAARVIRKSGQDHELDLIHKKKHEDEADEDGLARSSPEDDDEEEEEHVEVDRTQKVESDEWSVDIEDAVRAKKYASLLKESENVMIAFTSSSDCAMCARMRSVWHKYAHQMQQEGVKNLLVAEVDCSKSECPPTARVLPYYQWYHKGEAMSSGVSLDETRTTAETLLTTTFMMLEMEKKHTNA